jgi:hypothetical protein
VNQVRATTAEEAFFTLDPFALEKSSDPDGRTLQATDPWFCDLEKFFDRQHALSPRLKRLFAPPASMSNRNRVFAAVIGHKGTGKSTQIRKAITELEPTGIEPAFIDALAALDETDFTFSDVMLTITNGVVNALKEAKIVIPNEQLNLVTNWFQEELLTETHAKQINASIDTEARASGGIPFLANLMAKVTATLKSDNEYRTEIRKRTDPDPDDLVRRVNVLLDAANQALTQHHKRETTVVVVFDNLEKIVDRKQVENAILRRADKLRQLRCHVLLFLDPADQYAPIAQQAEEAFDAVYVPMLHVRNKADPFETVSPAALKAIHDLLDRRVDLKKVFADVDNSVLEIARMSGGRLRDILALARRACENVFSGQVKLEDIKYAARSLCSTRATAVKQHEKTDQWQRLAEIHRDKKPNNNPDDLYLMLHSLVLNYNGEQWWDVHPLVTLDERFTAAWKKLNP